MKLFFDSAAIAEIGKTSSKRLLHILGRIRIHDSNKPSQLGIQESKESRDISNTSVRKQVRLLDGPGFKESSRRSFPSDFQWFVIAPLSFPSFVEVCKSRACIDDGVAASAHFRSSKVPEEIAVSVAMSVSVLFP